MYSNEGSKTLTRCRVAEMAHSHGQRNYTFGSGRAKSEDRAMNSPGTANGPGTANSPGTVPGTQDGEILNTHVHPNQ